MPQATAYARLYRTNAVTTAPPGQLVLMMYDAALVALAGAREAFNRPPEDLDRIQIINREVKRAQSIFVELRRNIDREPNPDFAEQLHRLYTYYIKRCFDAHFSRKPEPIKEVEGLLGQLRDAWAQALRQPASPAGAEAPDPALAT
jgi:flagellar protein FliS